MLILNFGKDFFSFYISCHLSPQADTSAVFIRILLSLSQAGISAAPARAVSAVKEMNIPQKIKDIKLPDLPSIGNLKF